MSGREAKKAALTFRVVHLRLRILVSIDENDLGAIIRLVLRDSEGKSSTWVITTPEDLGNRRPSFLSGQTGIHNSFDVGVLDPAFHVDGSNGVDHDDHIFRYTANGVEKVRIRVII